MKTLYVKRLLPPSGLQGPVLQQQRIRRFVLISLGVSALLLGWHPQPGHSSGKAVSPIESIVIQSYFEPPGDGEPRDTVGAGSRQGRPCPGHPPSVQPLVADQSYGLTFQERPAIFAKVEPSTAQQAMLTFRNETGTYYQSVLLPVELSGEVAQFSLPASAPALTVGENYRWTLVLLCGNTVAPDAPRISGWVQRVARSKLLQSQLSKLSLLEQVQWYGTYGYWYDLLTTVGRAYLLSPEDVTIANLWHELVNPTHLLD
jgi:hypothetical protein